MKRLFHIITILFLMFGCNQSDYSNRETNGEDEENLLLKSKGTSTLKEDSSGSKIKIQNPIEKIDSIFNDFIKYQESTDSEDDKRIMQLALEQLDSNLTVDQLVSVINIWMYYDPTDFPTRNLTEKVLIINKPNSITAVRRRLNNKMEWENSASAPYSELNYLSKKLEQKKD